MTSIHAVRFPSEKCEWVQGQHSCVRGQTSAVIFIVSGGFERAFRSPKNSYVRWGVKELWTCCGAFVAVLMYDDNGCMQRGMPIVLVDVG
jgi:hypothetical protein